MLKRIMRFPKRVSHKIIFCYILMLAIIGSIICFWIFCFGNNGFAQPPASIPTVPPAQQSTSIASNPPVTPSNSVPLYQSVASPQPVSVTELGRQLIEFQKTLTQGGKEYQDFLRIETERHHKFLEWFYECSLKVLSGFIILVGAILVVLRAKTGEEIQRIVDEKINADVDAHIGKSIRQLTEGKIEDITIEANKRIAGLKNEYEVKSNSIIKIASGLSRACVVLDQESNARNDQERRDVLKLLKEIDELEPGNRTVAIFRGRLYKQLRDYSAAIKALDETISKRLSSGMASGQDYADILYNKACYISVLATEQAAENVKEQLRNEAWALLKESIRHWPANHADALGDKDFNGVTNEIRTWEGIKP